MMCSMENGPIFEEDVTDITPAKRRRWLWVVGAVVIFLFLFGSPLLGIYIDSLWFASLGYSDVYWYKFKLGFWLFLIFLTATFLIMRLPFVLLNRLLPALTERPRLRLASVQDIRDVNLLPMVYGPGVWILSAAVAFFSATSFAQQWSSFALFFNSAAAGASDPVFHQDISFYLFRLPVYELLTGWLMTLTGILFVVITGLAFYVNYIEKVRGAEPQKTDRASLVPVSLAGAGLALAFALQTFWSRFDILTNRHPLFAGANYTDANVRLPGLMALLLALLVAAIILVINGLVVKRLRLLVWATALVVVVWIVGVILLPQSIHSFSVKPNELAKESPYIQNNITATRQAFALDRFEERSFAPVPSLTPQHTKTNPETLRNVRLWDRDILQSVLSQIQEIRTYYEFKTPDVDRYLINGKLQQVMIAARELNVDQLQDQSRNWINQHLVYTHGYGVAMAAVNELTSEGQPRLLLKNMPVESSAPELQITRPEIYFGEATNNHVYVRTRPQGGTQPEFNYPAEGNQDSYSEYEGQAGIAVGGSLRQLALALYLGDGTNLLLSDYINAESRVLMRRNVRQRVEAIAPFLLFEDDPYIVIGRDGRLYWMIDGFSHSDRYPYATRYRVGSREVNYLRNSVKAVVDAYEGSVKFYVFEPDDAIVKSYQSVFPSLFLPADEMPEDLRQHVRYPSFMLDVQAIVYTLYHMQNPQTFFNQEDLWAIPSDEAKSTREEAQRMRPYHLLMQLPGEDADVEFVNIVPFTPAGQGRNNMIGWMAARSDGASYGQMLAFNFPKNVTINGPAQIRARINQDAQISQQMTLWSQKGTALLRGSLLVIPLTDTLLYVESFYLQAENSPLPELRLVTVATQERLAAGRNFEEALQALVPELRQAGAAGATSSPSTSPSTSPAADGQPPIGQPPPGPLTPQPSPSSPAGAASDLARLAQQAQQLLVEYERLTAQGKYKDAGEKLEQLKQTLNELGQRR